jgi:hypothetical protein
MRFGQVFGLGFRFGFGLYFGIRIHDGFTVRFFLDVWLDLGFGWALFTIHISWREVFKGGLCISGLRGDHLLGRQKLPECLINIFPSGFELRLRQEVGSKLGASRNRLTATTRIAERRQQLRDRGIVGGAGVRQNP